MNNSSPLVFNFNPLGCNGYMLTNDSSALVVETSGQIPEILDVLKKRAITNVTIAFTHGHFDHIAYSKYLVDGLLAIGITPKTLAGAQESPFFEETGPALLQETLEYFELSHVYQNSAPCSIARYLKDGDPLEFEDFLFVATPGHTAGSGVFYSESRALMFTGDTIFTGGATGRTDFIGGDALAMAKSVTKLLRYPPDTRIYPGHGPSGSIGVEKDNFAFNNRG